MRQSQAAFLTRVVQVLVAAEVMDLREHCQPPGGFLGDPLRCDATGESEFRPQWGIIDVPGDSGTKSLAIRPMTIGLLQGPQHPEQSQEGEQIVSLQALKPVTG